MLIGLILAILYSKYMLSPHEGGIPVLDITCKPIYRGMLIVPVGTYAIHIHHWIIYMVFLFFVQTQWFWYFCFFMMLQGITYTDSFAILEPNPYI